MKLIHFIRVCVGLNQAVIKYKRGLFATVKLRMPTNINRLSIAIFH
jgi:hypothetical protein